MFRLLRSLLINVCLRGKFKTRVFIFFLIVTLVALTILIVSLSNKCNLNPAFCDINPKTNEAQLSPKPKGRTIIGHPLGLVTSDLRDSEKMLTNQMDGRTLAVDKGSKVGKRQEEEGDHKIRHHPDESVTKKSVISQRDASSTGSDGNHLPKERSEKNTKHNIEEAMNSSPKKKDIGNDRQGGEKDGIPLHDAGKEEERDTKRTELMKQELNPDVKNTEVNSLGKDGDGKGESKKGDATVEEKHDGKEEETHDDKEEDKAVGQMSAEQMGLALSAGEMCKSVCPPFIWSKWSPCSKACGRGQRFRKAIYKFVCKSSDICTSNRLEEEVCDTPCKFDPSKYGGPGGLEMYPVSPLNPPIYPEDRDYMCGHWLVEYEKIHRDILLGKRPPSFLVYSTGKGEYPTAGGLASRIRGITTTFFMAVLLDRAFLIEWNDPAGLEKFLVPKSINWADLSIINDFKRRPPHDIGSWHSAKEKKRSSQWYMETNFELYFKHPMEIVQAHRYDFTYALLRNPKLMPKAYELGIDRVKCRICCAWDMLFKMSPEFEKEMTKLLISIGHPKKPILAVQVRTKPDDVKKAVVLAEHFVNCGQKITKEKKLKPAIIPIFNNRLVVHILAKKYPRYIKTPVSIEAATRTVHTHLGNLPADTELAVMQGVQERTFKEFFIMLNSTILIRSKGHMASFGNVADAIHRHYANPSAFSSYTAVGSSCDWYPSNFKIE